MTYKQAQKKIEQLADEIDNYLGNLERANKDKGKNYNALFEISCALRDLADQDFDN